MNRLKMFVENFVIFGLGGMISQLVPIIMIPIVTRMLPDMGYYGISDLSNTLVSFGGAIGVMGMYDAMYRMFFEKETDEDYKKQVCSTALVFTVGTSFLVSLTMVLGRRWIARIFFWRFGIFWPYFYYSIIYFCRRHQQHYSCTYKDGK